MDDQATILSRVQRDQQLAGRENKHPHVPLRIFLVDDHEDFITSLRQFLSRSKGMQVVGVAHSGEDALACMNAADTDLVLMDIFMKPKNGLEVTQILKAKKNPPKIIILSFYDSEDVRLLATESHADGFVSKSQVGVQLIEIIQSMFPEQNVREAPLP